MHRKVCYRSLLDKKKKIISVKHNCKCSKETEKYILNTFSVTLWGLYLFGWTGIKSLMGLPKCIELATT